VKRGDWGGRGEKSKTGGEAQNRLGFLTKIRRKGAISPEIWGDPYVYRAEGKKGKAEAWNPESNARKAEAHSYRKSYGNKKKGPCTEVTGLQVPLGRPRQKIRGDQTSTAEAQDEDSHKVIKCGKKERPLNKNQDWRKHWGG